MAEPIDDLFVRLGLETDEKQFNQADQMFSRLKTGALQFGAVIGAGFGLRELTFGFSESVEEMTRFADVFDVSAGFVDKLGFAFNQTGGDANDAFSSIRKIADLIEDTEWGDIQQIAFREGVDPRLLEGVESVEEAADRLSQLGQTLDPEKARRFFSALGFGDSEIRLFRGTGDESLQALMQEAEARASLSEEMQEGARELEQARGRLARELTGLSREISELGVGGLATAIDAFADALNENRGLIVDVFRSPERLGRKTGESLFRFTEWWSGVEDGLFNAPNMAPPGQQVISPEDMPTLWDRVGSFFGGPDSPGGGARQQNNITIDARGSTSPQETEQRVRSAVEQILPRMAEQATIDIESGAQ